MVAGRKVLDGRGSRRVPSMRSGPVCPAALGMSQLGDSQLESEALRVLGVILRQLLGVEPGPFGHHDDGVTFAALVGRPDLVPQEPQDPWELSGMTMASAPPAIPAISARYPQCRPMTSTRNTLFNEEAVTRSRSIASSAIFRGGRAQGDIEIRQVVIDCRGQADHRGAAAGEFCGAALRAVAADHDERGNVMAAQLLHGGSLAGRRLKCLTASGARKVPRLRDDPTHLAGPQGYKLPGNESGKAIAYAVHTQILRHAHSHHGAHCRIHARRITAAGQHRDIGHTD